LEIRQSVFDRISSQIALSLPFSLDSQFLQDSIAQNTITVLLVQACRRSSR
jgi:hypothetical protein